MRRRLHKQLEEVALGLGVDREDREKCALLLGEMSMVDPHLPGEPSVVRTPVVLSADRLIIWQNTEKNVRALVVIAIDPLSASE